MLLLKYFLNASTNNKQLNTTEKWLLLINTRNTFSHIARCPVRFQTAVGGHCRPTAGSQRRIAYRRGRSATTETATGQHFVYATGPALILVYRFFLLFYCHSTALSFYDVGLALYTCDASQMYYVSPGSFKITHIHIS